MHIVLRSHIGRRRARKKRRYPKAAGVVKKRKRKFRLFSFALLGWDKPSAFEKVSKAIPILPVQIFLSPPVVMFSFISRYALVR